MKNTKLRLGVMFGGRSGEHAVSLMSARSVIDSLDKTKYDVTQIGITRQGVWLVGEGALEALQGERTEALTPATLLPDPSRTGLRRILPGENGEMLEFLTDLDVIFPALHGTFGEDGTLQGLLEMAGMAYVGAGVLGSALGMDKAVFKDVMIANDIPVVESVLALRSELDASMDDIIARAEEAFSYPMFTKPANLGSSVGISKCRSRSDLVEGLLEAAQYDRRILIERAVEAGEIEVSVLGNDDPEASICGEIVPEADFYSYEAKYHDDRSELFIPARIPEETAERIRGLAVRAFKAIDLAGLARVDFFYEKESGEVYINELNTMPGFTQISMYPKLWEASGLPYIKLLDRLIELGLERKADRDRTSHQFRRDT